MTAAEFDDIRPWLTISEERAEAARQALVEGRKLHHIGEALNCTKQAVGLSVSAVWRTYVKYQESLREQSARAIAAAIVASESAAGSDSNQGIIIVPNELKAWLQEGAPLADTTQAD